MRSPGRDLPAGASLVDPGRREGAYFIRFFAMVWSCMLLVPS
jgi:hypothetical protein